MLNGLMDNRTSLDVFSNPKLKSFNGLHRVTLHAFCTSDASMEARRNIGFGVFVSIFEAQCRELKQTGTIENQGYEGRGDIHVYFSQDGHCFVTTPERKAYQSLHEWFYGEDPVTRAENHGAGIFQVHKEHLENESQHKPGEMGDLPFCPECGHVIEKLKDPTRPPGYMGPINSRFVCLGCYTAFDSELKPIGVVRQVHPPDKDGVILPHENRH